MSFISGPESSTDPKAVQARAWNLIPADIASVAVSPIPANPFIWLRADTLVSAGGLVSAWTDKSANGNTPTAAGAARPTLQAAAINGQPAVVFDGLGNFLQWAALDKSGLGVGFTLLFVFQPTPDGGGIAAGNIFTLSGASPWSLFQNSNVNFGVFDGGVCMSTDIGNVNAWMAFEYSQAGNATVPSFWNGNASVPGDNPVTTPPATNTFDALGSFTAGSFFYLGRIAEFVMYKRQLLPAERAQWLAYVFGRYAI